MRYQVTGFAVRMGVNKGGGGGWSKSLSWYLLNLEINLTFSSSWAKNNTNAQVLLTEALANFLKQEIQREDWHKIKLTLSDKYDISDTLNSILWSCKKEKTNALGSVFPQLKASSPSILLFLSSQRCKADVPSISAVSLVYAASSA